MTQSLDSGAPRWRWARLLGTAAMGAYPAIMGLNGDGIASLAIFAFLQGIALWLYSRRDAAHIPTGAQIFFAMAIASLISLAGYTLGALAS